MRCAVLVGLLVLQQGYSRTLPEEDSVVSVYTTLPTVNNASGHLDVYGLIANNIAERITSPIYRFFGINRTNTSTSKTTTKRPFSKIEILDDAQEEAKPDIKPVDNEILKEKDVEELSADALKKTDKKPEKITLYSNYLPAKVAEKNVTSNAVDEIESFDFDDDDDVDDVNDERRDTLMPQGILTIVLELFANFIQVVNGTISTFFGPK